MLANLKKLGFTNNEITIYSALLDAGQSSAGILIKKTGLHRNIVYDVLNDLTQQRLITMVTKENKKYFTIRSPQLLIDKAQQQLHITQELVKLIHQKIDTVAPEIITYEGKDGWQTAYRLLLKRLCSKDIIYTLGVGGDTWIEAMGDFFITWENFLKKNKIRNYMIGYQKQKEEIASHQTNKMRITRYLLEKHSIPANTEIFKDGIFIQIFTDPLMLIEIRSIEVAKGYKQHFDALWNIAKC